MAVIKAVSSKAGIGQALDYVTKEEKTEDKLVSGLHCEPDTVKDEMQATKELWEKTGGQEHWFDRNDFIILFFFDYDVRIQCFQIFL